MHRNAMLMRRIRFIDNPPEDNGGSDGGEGEGEPIDWEAKYHDAVKHSREWEKRAKDNKAAAEELEKLKESQMSEAEKTARRISELETKNAAYESEKQQAAWKAEVSKKTGVPADLLRGSTLEDIQAHAEQLDAVLHPKPKGAGLKDPGRTPEHKTNDADTSLRSYVGQLFGRNE